MSSELVVVAFIVLGVGLSAVSVVYHKHLSRKLFVELQRLERERDAMQVEWGKLQLEESTWATHDRIQRIAVGQLEMHIPPARAVVLVTP